MIAADEAVIDESRTKMEARGMEDARSNKVNEDRNEKGCKAE